MDRDQVCAAVEADGVVHLRGCTQLDLVDVIEGLGRPIHVEEVRDTPGARALVRSRDGIPWHTDHHRAERIVWYCLQQAEGGGETLLADGLAALDLLDPEHACTLRQVLLSEHSIFRGDAPRHPCVTAGPDGRRRLYYSLWFAAEEAPRSHRAALDALDRAIARVQHHRFRLSPGDILAIDNTRMLHARTALHGERPRHLRRYWLAAT